MKHIKKFNEGLFDSFRREKTTEPKSPDRFESSDEENLKVSRIVERAVSKNIKSPEYLSLKDQILNKKFDKSKILSNVAHKIFKIRLNTGEVLEARTLYINNYGDTGPSFGVLAYSIECPGHDNIDYAKELKDVISRPLTLSGVRFFLDNKEKMLISESEFFELYNFVEEEDNF
jgi:hypothetical protein